MIIKGILVSVLAPFENHIANGGEKLLGNASSIKRRPDGKVYVSGQMQRHVLFSAINRLNEVDEGKYDTFVSNGDGITNQIENDLRADMGGFMHPSKGDYSGRRTAPLSVTPAVAINKSEVGRDLLVRIKRDQSEDSKDQALATKEFSEYDLMHMNFFLDVSGLSISKAFTYKNSFNITTKYFKHAKENERLRRAKLFLDGTRYMNDYASQARNAVSGEPQKVLIVFDPLLGRKASRYFTASELEQKNILEELKAKGAKYYLGDDQSEHSVYKAYTDALTFLNASGNSLFDPSNDPENKNVKTFAKAFGNE
ncbi:type I-PGING CRISPR-associated protein Cas7/Csp1 [Labilibaculum euxinus]|uniref:Type I-PGING CRISPR-associated protein Cas7/Csp1 n=1 Tax=Labilibaculum euxinus TaxID=2686357 RepID=A0A7M4D9T1_9BACT|nr:type I-PGING CRISPR-associated protein Cas7/Csp1 [Labilibaculum euxinus]MUP39410.1 type I-PGING CRISPR-associated protein Cas7/Csp1 [Labilibaculum euxinus]MVB08615.1 type I-PGING CRISPR-associated protein Cas7/Csp1 [Labilibaculum euxinus]